jgi:hypothetical protein
MPDQLLFIQAGPGGWGDVQWALIAQGGLPGALVGSLFGPGLEKKTKARQQELDRASLRELLKLIEGDKHSFRAAPSELSDVRIEPKSIWHGAVYSNPFHVGLFRFKHRERGKITLELLWTEEMHVAVTYLPALLGEELSIKVVWNEEKKRYVCKR